MIKTKTKLLLSILIILAILVVIVVILFAIFDIHIAVNVGKRDYTTVKSLKWSSELNLVQSGNTCGAHSAMALYYSKKGIIEDPYVIYNGINEKLGNGYIYPWGLSRYLGRNKIEASIYFLWLLSDESKIDWIKGKINQNNPVIVVVGNRKYLHYITILGYDSNKLFVYDSLLERDINGEKPGNISLKMDELLGRMNTARFRNIPLIMAISE